MNEALVAKTDSVSGRVYGTAQLDSPRTRLRMSWAVDPATGKPVARWVVAAEQTARIIAFRPAA